MFRRAPRAGPLIIESRYHKIGHRITRRLALRAGHLTIATHAPRAGLMVMEKNYLRDGQEIIPVTGLRVGPLIIELIPHKVGHVNILQPDLKRGRPTTG
jgi:hypothetical protein